MKLVKSIADTRSSEDTAVTESPFVRGVNTLGLKDGGIGKLLENFLEGLVD